MTDAMPSCAPGPILAFAASPDFARDGTAFAAGEGGLLRTTDHGATWIPIRLNLSSDALIPTTAVAVSPTFDSDGTVLTAIPGGIGQSHDGSDTWRFTALPLPPPLVSAIAISPAFIEDGIAFAGTMEDGIFRTEDHGRSWLPWNFGLYDPSVLTVAVSPYFRHDATVYAGTSSGLYRSTNRGRSWRPIAAEMDCPAILSLAALPTNDGNMILFAGTEGDGLLRLSHSDAVLERIDEAALPESVQAIAYDPTGKRARLLLIIGDDHAASSPDGGMTWTPLANLSVDVEDITAVSPPLESKDGLMLFVGTSDGRIQGNALNGLRT